MYTLQWVLGIVIFLVCCLLILVILLQKGRGGGLAGAFGGAGGAGSAFGAKTGDVFTVVTVVLAGVFLLLNIAGNYVFLPAGETGQAAVTPVRGVPSEVPAPSTQPSGPADSTRGVPVGEAASPPRPAPSPADTPADEGQGAADDSERSSP